MNEEELYMQLGHLIEEMPEFRSDREPLPNNTHLWLARGEVLVAAAIDRFAGKQFSDEIENLTKFDYSRNPHAEKMKILLYRAFALSEMKAPAARQGAFIPAGNVFDAFTALNKTLQYATKSAMIIDPYLDHKVLTDIAILIPEQVRIQLLSDSQSVKPSLSPAASRWKAQHGSNRYLEVRLAAARTLHDRLIIADDKHTWLLTQSINAFAERSPASIVRVETEIAHLKIAAYNDIWANSPIV